MRARPPAALLPYRRQGEKTPAAQAPPIAASVPGRDCSLTSLGYVAPRGLADCQDLVGRNRLQLLYRAARPGHLETLDRLVRAQPEVHTLVARREIAARGAHHCVLLHAGFRHDVNSCPD